MNWSQVAKDLLAISKWPWYACPTPDEPTIEDMDGGVIASIPGLYEDAAFIAAAPRLLAEALVDRVKILTQLRQCFVETALSELGISPEDYAEIKRRLG